MSALTLSCAALALSGCLGTDVGNPADEGAVMRFEVDTPRQTSGVVRQALEITGGATITRAELGVRSVFTSERSAGPGCSSHGGRAALEDLTVTLIASGAGTTTTAPLDIAPGEYCQMCLTLAPVSSASARVTGKLADGRTFSITSSKSLRRVFSGRHLTFTGRGELLIAAVNVAHWIDVEELSGLEGERIVIDDDNHRELLARFEQRVRDSIQLVPDRNRNGLIDADERGILTTPPSGPRHPHPHPHHQHDDEDD